MNSELQCAKLMDKRHQKVMGAAAMALQPSPVLWGTIPRFDLLPEREILPCEVSLYNVSASE